MRLRSVFWLLILCSSSAFCQSSDTINYSVPGDIPIIRQPKEMDCWITVTTMLLSWKNQKRYTVKSVVDSLCVPWKIYFETNTGLPGKDQEAFIKKIGLKAEPPANYLLIAYLEFLRKYGPLWITTGDGFVAHARILVGIQGSGDYEKTEFTFINPQQATLEKMSALKFMNMFEEEAKAANAYEWKDLRVQIYHL
jgi:hypothetical protein